MNEFNFEDRIRPEIDKYQKILTQNEEGIEDSKQEILSWLIRIFDDAKSMGLDLMAVDHYIQVGMNAINSNDWDKALQYINQSINTLIKLGETSAPDLGIKKIKNIQFQANKWNKLNLEIYNKGNINALDIKLIFNGDFKIKLFPTVTSKLKNIIKVNGTKVLPIEIFPIKKGIFPLEIHISCKKMFDNKESKFEERLWIQAGDVFGNTKIKKRFGYHNGYLKMELDIVNEDPMDIKEVIFELNYDEKLLTLSHIEPVYPKTGKKFQIGHIMPSGKKNITLYFEPLLCTHSFIGGGVSYKDWQEKYKYLTFSPQKIQILCPILNTRNSIRPTEIKPLLMKELIYSGNKLIDIPLGLDIESILKICKELIFRNKVKLIQEMAGKEPRRIEVWFYGTSADIKNKFILKLRIDGDTNSIELFVASSNNAAITGLLTNLLMGLTKDLQARGIIESSLKHIENIALKENIILARTSLLFEQLNNLDRYKDKDYAQEIKDKCKPLIEKLEGISKRERFLIGHRRDGEVKLR